MAKLSDKQIEDKLKPIENRIKYNNNFTRADVQEMINSIIYHVESYDELKKHLEDMIIRTGVKKIGIRTMYTPRQGLTEEDKTLSFLKDLRSYQLIGERFFRDVQTNRA
jgi:hypothetical protein